jgi:hypothetical protein
MDWCFLLYIKNLPNIREKKTRMIVAWISGMRKWMGESALGEADIYKGALLVVGI